MDELTRLAVAARGGNEQALASFVRLAMPDVWRFCARAGDRQTADDLTQETFERAIGALRSFRAEASARTWLLSIATRVCADAIRRSTRRRAVMQAVRVQDDGVVADHGGQVELVALVDALTPDRRTAFVLTQVLGVSYEEAATICECPIGTIRSRVARARADLVVALERNACGTSIAV